MTKPLPILALVLLIVPAAARAEPHVVAYVPNWIDTAAFAPTIRYDDLTHINIAFENPTGPEGDLSFNPGNQILIDRARASGVKILVSIGGGSASENEKLRARYFDLLANARRHEFVAKLADYVEKHGFDGLDVDLEGPAINRDYGPFIADLAAALKPRDKLLTAALSRGYGGKDVPDSALSQFDFINVMAYDATGPWNPDRHGPHSSLEFARENIAYWRDRGVPKGKLVLGVPFYGRAFGPAARKRGHGYDDIVAAYPGAEMKDQAGDTVWYDGIPTIKAKSQYVLDEGLGGVMIWSLDNDAPGDKSLLSAIAATLKSAPATP